MSIHIILLIQWDRNINEYITFDLFGNIFFKQKNLKITRIDINLSIVLINIFYKYLTSTF